MAWYAERCDGEWEHHYGVSISTIDNPGWRFEADLNPAGLPGLPGDSTEEQWSDGEWLHVRIESGRFIAHCSPRALEAALRAFLALVKRAPASVED
jgi:hypothetical protein